MPIPGGHLKPYLAFAGTYAQRMLHFCRMQAPGPLKSVLSESESAEALGPASEAPMLARIGIAEGAIVKVIRFCIELE